MAAVRPFPVGRDIGERAYYGGNLVAESMSRTAAQRAADCVNFCAGIEFKPGHAYVGGLNDLLDLLEQFHEEMREPDVPTLNQPDRDYFSRWSDVDAVLKQFGRDSWARMRRQESA